MWCFSQITSIRNISRKSISTAGHKISGSSTPRNNIYISLIFRQLGLYGFTFVDFGDAFKCFDQTGLENKPCLISSISQDKEGIVLLHEDKRHPF
jgi:membrane carboxypeptidase/penicillin-binding protein